MSREAALGVKCPNCRDVIAGHGYCPMDLVDETIEQHFDRFHAANPEVYRLFCRFTAMLIERGFSNYSADAVFHRIRWHTNVETTGAEPFKLNDHHTALYARLWMQDHPQHDGFFRTRVRRAL